MRKSENKNTKKFQLKNVSIHACYIKKYKVLEFKVETKLNECRC